MCLDPVSLAVIGTAVMAAGSGMQYFGQKKADNAMFKQYNREETRQKGFEKEQVGMFEDSLHSTRAAQDPAAQAAAAAGREAEYNSAAKSASTASAFLPGSASAPAVVGEAANKAGAASDARTSQLAKSLANLGGLTDVLQRNDINIGRNSQKVAQLSGFRRGSLDVLQTELDAAKHKGSTLRTLGGLAQSIGSMMMSGGIGGMGGPAAIGATGGMTAGSGSALMQSSAFMPGNVLGMIPLSI